MPIQARPAGGASSSTSTREATTKQRPRIREARDQRIEGGMRICFNERKVTLSIGEFSDFTDSPVAPSTTQGGLWRAQVGQAWHGELQRKTEAEETGARFEVPIKASWPEGGWTFDFQGRLDQVIKSADGPRIREIKTITSALPADEDQLRADYPAYFIQLATYMALYSLALPDEEPAGDGELLFVEIQSGIMQPVAMPAGADTWFRRQLDRLLQFLERRRKHLEGLRNLRFQRPFSTPRPGQENIREEIETAYKGFPFGLLEAPTGFGKTGIVLEYALNQLKAGAIDRVVYLTSKGSGQIQAAAQLEGMLGGRTAAPFFQMRSKAEHCIHTEFRCFRETCPFLDRIEERWQESGLGRHVAGRGDGELLELESVRQLGRQAGVCPFEITRSLLPFLDIWLADYNYVFSPHHRGFFFNQPGFDPDRTLLIVDEAHNLPTRAADCLSHTVHLQDLLATMTELQLTAAPPRLLGAWEAWLDFLHHLEPADELPLFQQEELREIVERVAGALQSAPPAYVDLTPGALDRISDVFAISQALATDSELEMLAWSPGEGELRLTCLDAGPLIGETLKTFPKSILMSATFGPTADFLAACRIEPEETAQVAVDAPWRKNAYDVAADLRPDTRYRKRKEFFSLTADTIAELSAAGGPVAVFFPSYKYAGDVLQRLDWEHPEIRVAMQKRGQSLPEQTAFLEESLLLSDVLFLILGGSFAEGIDLLGGRVRQTLVVGPALPEVNAPRRIRMERLERHGRAEAFRQTYQIPALQKINQALGRLVRAPGQRTRVLLHCQRFADKSYESLLHPDLRPSEFLLDDNEVKEWIRAKQKPVAET